MYSNPRIPTRIAEKDLALMLRPDFSFCSPLSPVRVILRITTLFALVSEWPRYFPTQWIYQRSSFALSLFL